MTKARTLADFVPFDSTGVLTSTSSLDAAQLTGNLPALDGSALTNLPASSTTSFRVERSNDQNITSGSETIVQFNATDFDTASGWNNTTYKYIIPETGKWLIAASVFMTGGGNNTMPAGFLHIYNGNDSIQTTGLTANTGSLVGTIAAASSGVFQFTQGDEVCVKAYVTAGAARVDGLGTGSQTNLSGFKID